MRIVILLLLISGLLGAQDITFFTHNGSDSSGDKVLPSAYQFADTPEGSSSDLTLRAVNTSGFTILLGNIYIGNQPGSAVLSPHFSITGLNQSAVLGPGASTYFVLHFIPIITGDIAGYLQASYAVQKNNCVIGSTDPSTQCRSTISAVAVLTGRGTDRLLTLSYSVDGTSVTAQPNSSSPIDFGKVSTSSKQIIVFTLSNQTAGTISIPAIKIQNAVYESAAFSVDLAGVPGALGANASTTFRVTFAPAQRDTTTATLMVGLLPYGLRGTGTALASIDALEIYYVDQTGVRTLPQAASPISFGEVVAGSGGSSTLTFTLSNPSLSLNAVAVSGIGVSGNGFNASGLPGFPANIQPGASITFAVTFTPGAAGIYSGALSIGTRQFSLSGVGTASQVPTPTFVLSHSPLVSQQQVTLTVQLASVSSVAAIGTLKMAFVPSISGVSDDPAILFTSTSTRQLQLNVAAGGQTATYSGQSGLVFQTGTTAGTITFTLTFPNGAPYSQSFTISPAAVQLTSATAVRKAPNLLITLTGCDNTYSAGQMSFTFYDLSGKAIAPSGLSVDATSAFHHYFFTSNQAGGAFSAQATFPVNGDTSQVGSVVFTMTNAAGTFSATQNFQ